MQIIKKIYKCFKNFWHGYVKNMEITIILGARPEIPKMSQIIRECEKQDIDLYIPHEGQHYTSQMDRIFFKQLKLPEAKNNLDGSGKHGQQSGKMFTGIVVADWIYKFIEIFTMDKLIHLSLTCFDESNSHNPSTYDTNSTRMKALN